MDFGGPRFKFVQFVLIENKIEIKFSFIQHREQTASIYRYTQ